MSRNTSPRPGKLNIPQLQHDAVRIAGGMNTTVSPLMAPPGTVRLAFNYESAIAGGLQRVGGFEPFDGRAAPSAAVYTMLECSGGITGVSVGNTLTGNTSGATGTVIYVTATRVAVTQVTGTFALEVIKVGGTPVGTVTSVAPTIDGFLDNTVTKAAADVYQALIGKVPGSGAIRGLAILNDVVYAWRDNAGATAMAIYKSSSSGWTAVSLFYELSFNTGSVQPAEGSTLVQGAVSATVKRVVLESGSYGAGTAAGRYIITQPSGGAFAAGALTTAGAGTVPAAGPGVYIGSQITLTNGGRVRTDRYAFTGSTDSMRLYGCDGVNREFEFDGTVLVPITTGMTVRASAVRCHKYHLFFAFKSSIQNSGTGLPYQFTPITGASEFGTGDTITGLVSVGGSEANAALMVLCQNSLLVLYGNIFSGGSADAKLTVLSRVSGAAADTACDIGGVVAFDNPGVVRYPTTQAFGNFLWDRLTTKVQALVDNKTAVCAVHVQGQSRYRIFFSDGTAMSGYPTAQVRSNGTSTQVYDWTVLSYGVNVQVAINDEIAGIARTFYGDDQGWVYEADKGRSFAGQSIQYGFVLTPLAQNSPLMLKQYKSLQLEIQADSACTIYTQGDFTDTDQDQQQQTNPQFGTGLIWDLTNWDTSYWGTPDASRFLAPFEGLGTSATVVVAGESDSELPNQITAATLVYIPRRTTR